MVELKAFLRAFTDARIETSHDLLHQYDSDLISYYSARFAFLLSPSVSPVVNLLCSLSSLLVFTVRVQT